MTDLGSKTTLRVMVILRGQLQANHSLPNGGGQVGGRCRLLSRPRTAAIGGIQLYLRSIMNVEY